MKKKTTTRVTVIVIIMIIGVVGYYAYLSNKSREQKQEVSLTEVQETLSRDLARDYPPTPKEVIKFYNEILNCFYNEECSDAEIEDLGNKARELYDAELLENNELGTYLLNLQADIAEYKEKGRRIASVAVASSTNVEQFEEDGFEFARIMCTYNIMEGGTNHPTRLVYLLRRDESKQWKIYGWKPAEEVELEK